MPMTIKEASEELLRIADAIESDADKVTEFVCNKCNHTATLENINAKRATDAKEVGDNVTVSNVTVNDKIHCPACDGIMAYKATEASSKFYFNAGDEEEEEKKEEEDKDASKCEEKEEEKEASEPIDYDSLERYASK